MNPTSDRELQKEILNLRDRSTAACDKLRGKLLFWRVVGVVGVGSWIFWAVFR